MRLQSQLNVAFTALLFVIMTVTGYVVYSLILNVLIQNEEKQLEEKGELLVHILNEETSSRADLQRMSDFLDDQNLQLFLYDRNQNAVLFSSLSERITKGFLKQNDFSNNKKGLWEYGTNKFVTSRILFYPESSGIELILLTPLDQLRAVQANFIERMLVVFVIGGMAAIMLSYFLTRKLVTPLSRLKLQLKRIETRQFDGLERVNATGEIKEVEESVYDMAKELHLYMQSQQTFFQNASHELKTPLMTIQGYAEGIRDHVFDDEEQQKGLDIMVSEVKRLKEIINEMTLLAKLDSEESVYTTELLKVEELIETALDRVLPLAHEKNIELKQTIEQGLMIQADEEKLLRALLNIILNSIRHTKSLLHIKVNKEKRMAVILVTDDGSGISKELLPHIFHRFVKGKDGETGLGLAIARAIVEQSGGQITAGTSEYGGALFRIQLPLVEKGQMQK